MSTHKHIDRICIVAVILSLIVTLIFMNGEAFGIQATSRTIGYEDRLFDTSRVHTIDIVMDDWDSFIETCENEEYEACSVVIDGEAYKNVGIRAKGNTSLSTVSSMNSDRYSFKVEFDQYDSTKSYYGLDKLSLNNIIQDTTFMKDFLTYQMMGSFGVAAPLCSYVYITVNGEDWGLYLAVEGVENSFLQRNYGSDYGELYKPDSMSFGGGRGNGKDFNIGEFQDEEGNFDFSDLFGDNTPPTASAIPDMSNMPDMSEMPEMPEMPENFDPSELFSGQNPFESDTSPGTENPDSRKKSSRGGQRGGGGMGFGGMGSSDVKLQYIDDDPDSYSNIFNNAKTDISEADQTRLIQALKSLSEQSDLEDVVDIDEVLRYFVVHNFVCNGDSYTGSMIHNYYLYEEDGQLSMIPWDYNLAFGTFHSSDATSTVNSPIDTPVSGSSDDRPMIDWIFSSDEYTDLYHQYFAEFLNSTDFSALIDTTAELIAPYVEKDPGKFYTYEEFEAGVSALREFCLLRAESVQGQLNGTIPSTTEGQSADDSALVDASHITISDMGSMNMGGDKGGFPDGKGNMGSTAAPGQNNMPSPNQASTGTAGQGNMTIPQQGNMSIPEQGSPTPPGQNMTPATETAAGEDSAETADNTSDSSSKGNFSRNDSSGNMPAPTTGMQNVTVLPLMGIYILILIAGLVFAFRFKRH